jgi:PAS domain S-box-containing protein
MDQDAIGAETIRAALDLLLAQPPLRKSPQLSAFLSYVVGETLAGRGSQLKSYTIATDALGRSPNFDPATDAIVRVEARRLRQVLRQIYADPACPVPVRIELPLGRYEPNFVRISGVVPRRETDAAACLRESEQRYRALVEASAAIEWRAMPDGGFVQSFGWTVRTGQSDEDLRNRGWLNVLHPDDRAETARIWAEACRTGEPVEVAYRVLHLDGGYRWMLSRGLPLENPDGTIREWVGTVSDIHERVMAEEALRTRDEGLRLAVEAAGIVTWEIDPETRRLTWSERARALFDAEDGPLDAWIARIDREDAPGVAASLERALRGEGRHDVVYRIAGPHGRRWVSSRAGLVRAARGEVRFLGVAADVTDRYGARP